MKSIRNKLAIGSAALIIGASSLGGLSGCTVFEDIVNDPLPRFLQSGSYRDRKESEREEEREIRNQQKQMIIPKYESGDTYSPPGGKNFWTRRKDGLWESTFSEGKIYTATDAEVAGFSKTSGVPVVRPPKKQYKIGDAIISNIGSGWKKLDDGFWHSEGKKNLKIMTDEQITELLRENGSIFIDSNKKQSLKNYQ